MQNKKNKRNTGYTIIETMISVSLFVIIIVVGMGSLLNANLLYGKSQGVRSIMDNMSFIMEDMSRNLRTGYHFHCFNVGEAIPSSTSSIVSTPQSCAHGWAISFESSTGVPANNDDQWIYYIDNTGKVFKSTNGPYLASHFVQMSPDEVYIDPVSSGFAVLGAESQASASVDKQQPFVTIRLVGRITFKNVVTPFYLQTSVSQRLVDIGS